MKKRIPVTTAGPVVQLMPVGVMAKLSHGSLVVLVPEAPTTLIGMVGKTPLTAFHRSR